MNLAARLLHTRALVRAPIWLYRAGLGFLLGDRLLLMQHRGRVSGQARSVVLEVADRPAPDRLVVVSGMGPTAQWYRNVLAEPRVLVSVGTRRDVRALAHALSPAEAAATLEAYARDRPRPWAALRPVLTEWALPLAAATGEDRWERVVPVIELRLLD
ncbi:deazaflavin-dependent oxidoreductase (nitroreductase family) [Isoptericola sp. CG 20/1183]|uniref:Deazaflavin-dependent oxidoreductase (Nitroreductase family) n=1 Tax=Isoptericola halotolerans TaxID=300560 RepID=A0ABX5EK24_9MICO|nr:MULTISPECIES: nitroreductase family deazaflavin-dependent oxidoreductase [Isoptericola]MCK0117590.1 nitroreductase family deazaflavin-dependent oxidoreductase [Isoptericola sp. S6320L]PRZ04109.1 deazaflavin-dependent oxidoreductase (nitroreductase family) [Isoptericola sp. CG 20/1183]PRZ10066.1 deazaflavin-dependent oxidoreductase (nitroreductase family) [Isoptericola halotolerans]